MGSVKMRVKNIFKNLQDLTISAINLYNYYI